MRSHMVQMKMDRHMQEHVQMKGQVQQMVVQVDMEVVVYKDMEMEVQMEGQVQQMGVQVQMQMQIGMVGESFLLFGSLLLLQLDHLNLKGDLKNTGIQEPEPEPKI